MTLISNLQVRRQLRRVLAFRAWAQCPRGVQLRRVSHAGNVLCQDRQAGAEGIHLWVIINKIDIICVDSFNSMENYLVYIYLNQLKWFLFSHKYNRTKHERKKDKSRFKPLFPNCKNFHELFQGTVVGAWWSAAARVSPTPASPASATGGCWRTGSTGRNATVLMTGVMGLGQLGKLIFTYTCMYHMIWGMYMVCFT